MTKSSLTLAAIAIATACGASAQPNESAPPRDAFFYVANGPAVMPFGAQVDVIRGEGAVIGGVVEGKPYSASSITESVQVLADGNRIVSRNEAKIYRDSAGRTRREQTLGGLGVWQAANEPLTMITINDPVADTSYFLDPARHVARKLRPLRLALDAGAVNGTFEAPAPAPSELKTFEPAVGTRRVFVGRDGPEPREIIVHSAGPGGDAPPPPPGAPPPVISGAIASIGPAARGFAFGAFGIPGADTSVEDLGEQVLEGVLAHGTRTTQTIPAGAIGNERPIEIVAEEWYSADIEAVVLRRNVDPRFGETTYRLVSLVRGEPSPDLFVVPDEYALDDDFAFAPARRVEMRALEDAGAAASPAEPRPGRRTFLVPPGGEPAPQ